MALKTVGHIAVKQTTDLNGENSFYVGRDFVKVTAKSIFNRLDDSLDDTVTFKILGKVPNATNVSSLFEVWQNSDRAEGDGIYYWGSMAEDNNLITKKYVDDAINFYSYPELV